MLRRANICENTSVNMHILWGSAKLWLTPPPSPPPVILQPCQRKCKPIPSFPNKLNPAGGILASQASKHMSPPHFKNTHTLISGGMQPPNYFSGLNLRRLGSCGCAEGQGVKILRSSKKETPEGDRIFKERWGIEFWRIDTYTRTRTRVYNLLSLFLLRPLLGLLRR